MPGESTSARPELRVGTILMPGEYMRGRKSFISGMILEVVDDLWGMNYRIALTNGNVVWKDESTIRDLWVVVEEP